jgi:transcriptional regulator with XRE-family HTH domain
MRLAEARRRSGYSARGIAKATGSSTRTIWELEKGRRLPEPRTIRKFAKVLAVPAGDVEEFREAIRRRASRGAPLEVLAQVEQVEVDIVDTTVIRVAAQRSLREVMEYLVKQGEFEVVDRIYREVCEEATGREEASIGSDTES